jgi:hypothetical protein
MRRTTIWLLLIPMFVSLLYSSPQKEKTLAELYEKGTVSFVPELTIDDSTMPEDAFFESISDIAIGPEGCVYACDYRANNIKKFDSSGKYLDTIGREGQGPGEFNMPFKVVASRDRLFVWDLRNRRICTLTLNGEFIKSIVLSYGSGNPQKMRIHPNGDLIVELEKINMGEMDKPQECIIDIYSPDLVWKKNIYTKEVWKNKFIRNGRALRNVVQPFASLVYWDVHPLGKITVGFSGKAEIELIDITSGDITSFEYDHEPIEITDQDKKAFFAGGSITDGTGVQKISADEMAKYRKFPKLKPFFMHLLCDSEGNILVWPYIKKREEEWKYFDAYDSAGRFIESVRVTGERIIPKDVIIQNGYFWLRRFDKDGFVKLVKYRIAEASENGNNKSSN